MYSVHPTRQHSKYIHMYYCMCTCTKILVWAYSCQTSTWNNTVSGYWEREKYGVITLDFNYTKRQVHLTMLKYIKDSVIQFQHPQQKLTDQPHKRTKTVSGATIQYAKEVYTSKKLDDDGKKFIQQVTGIFLYYARAVDPTILVALRAISSSQAAPTEATMYKEK